MAKKSRQNLNILRTKRAFKVKWKAFFIIFKGLSVDKNGLRLETAPLNIMIKPNFVYDMVVIAYIDEIGHSEALLQSLY